MKIKQLGLAFILVFMLSFSSIAFVVADTSIDQYWNFGTFGADLGSWVMTEGTADEFYLNSNIIPTFNYPRSYPWFLIDIFTDVDHEEDIGSDRFTLLNYLNFNVSGGTLWNVFSNSDDGDKLDLEIFTATKANLGASWNMTGGKTMTITLSTVVKIVDADNWDVIDIEYLRNDTYTFTVSNRWAILEEPYGNALTYTPPDSILDSDRVIVYIYCEMSLNGDAFDNEDNFEYTSMANWFLDDVRVRNWGVGSKDNLGGDVGETPVTEDDLTYVYPFEWDNPETETVYYYPTYSGFNFQNNFTEYFDPNFYREESVTISGDVYNSIPYSMEFVHGIKKNNTAQDYRSPFITYPTMNLTFTNPNDDSLLSLRFNSRVFYVEGNLITGTHYKNINITVRFLTIDGTLLQETPIRNLRFFNTNNTNDDNGFVTGTATLDELGFNAVNVQIRINSSIYLYNGLGAATMSQLTYKTYIDDVSSNWESGFWNPLTNIPYPDNIPVPPEDDDVLEEGSVEDYLDKIRDGLNMGTEAGGLFLSMIMLMIFLITTMIASNRLNVALPSVVYIIIIVISIGLFSYMTLLPSWVMIAVLVVIAGLGVRGAKKVFT